MVVNASGDWKVTVNGATIQSGVGSRAFSWDGVANGKLLDEGKYTLTLTQLSTKKTTTVDVIIDNSQPAVAVTSFEYQSWASDGSFLTMTGKASVKDNGLAGLDPTKTKITILGTDITGNPDTKVSADGSSITFTFSVTPKTKSRLAYHVAATNAEIDDNAGAVAVDISAFDKAGNVIGKPFNYDFYYPNSIAGVEQMARGVPAVVPQAPNPLPKAPAPKPNSRLIPIIVTSLSALTAPMIVAGVIVIVAAYGIPYDPREGSPPKPPPPPPRPRPGPGPEPSGSPVPSPGPTTPYDAASQPGGRHHGKLQEYLHLPSSRIQSAIKNLENQIKAHLEYINNPHSKVPDFATRDPRYQAGLIKHWQKEIQNFRELISIAQQVLRNRGELP